ncbi:Ent3p NDAI_0D03200 [Naumovozyma dairenensis CBS 421]|uniref:ENTH domain-containing protein n=1 Tax=Naumovozyma dairenensis (strain ATCC 10597 / BCRC 20456 / CBS 421 / NBRC 0211 / NRRL Y-12639) TaxID=1071378 RepID=G0WA23_NAUDC|nr:hypothetical protein NDAI_0D03200 [Naumovozyma dairenensis CBS 421]CCD24634.1 hypothetical protein NDAI_0D03200 [Naumovozyma dairenensis CBS 421]
MSLEDTLSNMTLYDAKKYFRKAQNVVFNYTEMESKVREATNNEPWGASSTLMEQIAQGTYNVRERYEIVGMIFRRFTEKAGSEWRQIYKALQLLDYLIKHGSEPFIDDVRSSLKLIQMLETFHYIDSEGRDQGINVRNRAKLLVELLQDDSNIRQERKKARETSKKYKGVAGGSAATTMNGSLTANTRAGFTVSGSQGISVSADFDSDDSDNEERFKSSPYNDRSSARGRFKDDGEQPSSELTTANKLLDTSGDNIVNATVEGDDDDEDDFDDFQSAPPVPSQSNAPIAQNNISSLLDIDGTSFNANATPYQPQLHIQPVVVPAISSATNTKKDDPFGSLFSSAKASSASIPKPVKPITNHTANLAPSTSTNIAASSIAATVGAADDEDDLFGDMTSSTAANTNNATTNSTSTGTTNSTNNNGSNTVEEVDLLMF